VISDNGSCYKSKAWRRACDELGVRPNEPAPTGRNPTASCLKRYIAREIYANLPRLEPESLAPTAQPAAA
jgi:transposase InsO family protein